MNIGKILLIVLIALNSFAGMYSKAYYEINTDHSLIIDAETNHLCLLQLSKLPKFIWSRLSDSSQIMITDSSGVKIPTITKGVSKIKHSGDVRFPLSLVQTKDIKYRIYFDTIKLGYCRVDSGVHITKPLVCSVLEFNNPDTCYVSNRIKVGDTLWYPVK
jgi:hypothetical protein